MFKNKSLLVWIATGLAITILLVTVTAGVAYLVANRIAAAKEKAAGGDPTKGDPKNTVLAGEWSITTNLADIGSHRYIQLKFRIEVPDEKAAKELTEKETQLRADILALLAGKTVADVSGEQGLLELQGDILERINRSLTLKALKVYVTDRVIQ
ncbi:MAG: flagellar basal body-associated protein FliL [Chloroflexota bacterium]